MYKHKYTQKRQLCNFIYSMHNIHINMDSYLQHLFNARYLASHFNNMLCRGTTTSSRMFLHIDFALNIAINRAISLYKSSPMYSNK